MVISNLHFISAETKRRPEFQPVKVSSSETVNSIISSWFCRLWRTLYAYRRGGWLVAPIIREWKKGEWMLSFNSQSFQLFNVFRSLFLSPFSLYISKFPFYIQRHYRKAFNSSHNVLCIWILKEEMETFFAAAFTPNQRRKREKKFLILCQKYRIRHVCIRWYCTVENRASMQHPVFGKILIYQKSCTWVR